MAVLVMVLDKIYKILSTATVAAQTVILRETARSTPTMLIKISSQRFFTVPAALLGLLGACGNRMAIKEINDAGGLLGG